VPKTYSKGKGSSRDHTHREFSPKVRSIMIAGVVSIVVLGLAFIVWVFVDFYISSVLTSQHNR
jgi:phosphotransferase system  glucose/maltose/N-acetylglucosamine-specific IIC component